MIAGGILKKVGNRRFTCFGNDNDYYELVKQSLIQSDTEEDSKTEITSKHNRLSMDTDVPKVLKQAMVI